MRNEAVRVVTILILMIAVIFGGVKLMLGAPYEHKWSKGDIICFKLTGEKVMINRQKKFSSRSGIRMQDGSEIAVREHELADCE